MAHEARDFTRELTAQRPRRLFGRCDYCGWPCTGPTCPHHRDLLQLDPLRFFDPRALRAA
jgi:hypothetical protein